MKKKPSRIAKIDYGIHLFLFGIVMIICLIQTNEQEVFLAIAFLFTGFYQLMSNFFKLFVAKGTTRKYLYLYWLLSMVYLGLFFLLIEGLIDAKVPQGVYLLFILGAFALCGFSLYISYRRAYGES